MAKTFTDMVSNVATDIIDTSAEMQSIIGRYINNRYRQVLRATNFEVIDDDYTIATVVGTQTYSLPANFGKELYVVSSTNNRRLDRTTFNELGTHYQNQLTEQGTPVQYVIFRDDSDTQKVLLFPIPDAIETLKVPYIVKIRTDLSGTDTPINDFADLLEVGATADAWRYKRQFTKARSMDVLFDQMLDEYMWDAENQENDPHQFSADSDDYPRQQPYYYVRER